MKKSSKQQEKLFVTLAKEAEEDIKKNGTISWEEFWEYADGYQFMLQQSLKSN